MSKKRNPEYNRIHSWLVYRHGKAQVCGGDNCTKLSTNYEWALKKGYKHERNISNYRPLCKSCHNKYDLTEADRASLRKANRERIISKTQRRKNSESHKRPVVAYMGEEMHIFESGLEASKTLNVLSSGISSVLSGRYKTCGGYYWRYV